MNKEKDLNDLKKWFKNLGLEIDGKIKDDDIKKYVIISIYLKTILQYYFIIYLG